MVNAELLKLCNYCQILRYNGLTLWFSQPKAILSNLFSQDKGYPRKERGKNDVHGIMGMLYQ